MNIPSNKKRLFSIILLLILLGSSTLHVYKLSSIPMGFFLDETSNAFNAQLISESGRDEHDQIMPLYFESFGEFKNPIYIYSLAFLFKTLGFSEFSIRFTSFLFFLIGLMFFSILINQLFPKRYDVLVYSIISYAFLPVFFSVSRLGFEVISQLTWVSATTLLVWLVFHGGLGRSRSILFSVICGLLLGTSIYTYSTARLLTFVHLLILLIAYFKRENLKTIFLIITSFSVALIPYILYSISNPGNLTDRFKLISFIYSDISLMKKVVLLIRNYLYYWTPNFLILQGDPEIRHGTEYGGIIFSTTMVLFVVGLLSFTKNKKINRFHLFLFLCLLSSPIAAALTLEGTPHSLRSFLLGYFILVLSCYGYHFISNNQNKKTKPVFQIAIVFFLLFEVFGYQFSYFVFYPPKSVKAMGSYNFRESLKLAIGEKPDQVVFFNKPRITYTNLEFYSRIVENPDQIPINLFDDAIVTENTCIVFHKWNIEDLENIPFSYVQYDVNMKLSLVQRLFDVKKPENIIKVRCFFDR